MINLLRKFSIIIFILLALIVSRMGISYIIILIAIGLIVSFINQRKREAIITGVLYALVSYILSYPAGLFLSEYMPTTDIVIETSTLTVAENLIIGALIPMIIAFILCSITAIIGSNIAKTITNDKKSDDNGYQFNMHNFDSENSYDDTYQQPVKDKNKSKKDIKNLIKLTPIDKAKMKRQKGEDDD